MKSLKVISLLLIAASLASGAVYAKGGGSASSADHAQRTEIRSQDRVQQRTHKRAGSQSGDALRHENRNENHEQMRQGGGLPSMQ